MTTVGTRLLPSGRCGPVLIAFAMALALLSAATTAATRSAGPDDYRALLRQLEPGDRLVLEAGHYRRGLPIHGLNVTPEKPIVIEGPAQGRRAVMLGRPGNNIVSIKDSSYVVIRNLEIDGQGAFVDGVKAEGSSRYTHHITLENLHIHSLRRHQQSVGISTKSPSWGWVVRANRIVEVGTGMYFGNSDGTAPFIGGIIERNQVINTIGYNLQIKHQIARPTIRGMPTHPQQTVIRDNVFVKDEGGSEDDLARPNVLVGHLPREGPGDDDRYVIHGNLFFQNRNEALFQGEGNVVLHSNLFFNSHASGFPAIAIQPHNGIPREVRVAFNTVVSPQIGIRVRRSEQGWVDDQWLVGNAVFADTPLRGGRQADNLVFPYAAAAAHLEAPVDDIDRLDLSPRGDNLSGSAVDFAPLGKAADYRHDIDGNRRTGSCRGAYACK